VPPNDLDGLGNSIEISSGSFGSCGSSSSGGFGGNGSAGGAAGASSHGQNHNQSQQQSDELFHFSISFLLKRLFAVFEHTTTFGF
jgi:hypothetical protein